MRKTKTIQKVPFLGPDVLTKVIPAPTDGWDQISPLAEMDPKRAPIMQNWVPRPGYVELRGGYQAFASAVTSSAVESLMVRRSPSGEKMFAAADSHIADVSFGGSGSVVVSGLANARFQCVNFTPGGGTTVIQCVNGVDPLQMYDGTSWTTPSITGFPVGFSSSTISNINSQKRRLWYCLKNSSIVAFMPTDAITGAIAGTLDFGALWAKGGYLVAMTSWTVDGGSGPQDYAAFISSRGQITIYAGTDPTNANAWSLVGTFDVSPPIGNRCFLRVGSDVMVITQAGVIPMSQALPFDPSADRSVAVTARIQNAMASASLNYSGNFGWQLVSYPFQQLILLNVPFSENVQQNQFIMNTLTGAWGEFTGWNFNCFEIFNNNLYSGGNSGIVNQCYIGTTDNGASIPADVQCAFNWLDEPGRVKRMTMVQPLLTVGSGLTPTMAVDTDFMTSTAVAPVTTLSGGSLWDQAKWDSAVWSATSINFTSFLSVDAIGHSFAIRMRVNINDPSASEVAAFDSAVFDTAIFDANYSSLLPVLQINAFNSIAEMGGAL